MATEWIQLRNFNESELIFYREETRSILKFFFQADRELISSLEITYELRNLAQGLLVAAVDATYAMGWIELTFRWSANPGAGMKKALEKLAVRGAKHWFKNLKDKSLSDLRIYERVRDQLAVRFRTPFRLLFQADVRSLQKVPRIAHLHLDPIAAGDKFWG